MSVYNFVLAGALSLQFTNNSPLDITDSQLLNLAARIPGCTLISKDENPNATINIVHLESSNFSISDHKEKIVWHQNWEGKLSPDFVHVFYGVARRAWLNTGIMPVHGACIGTKEKGYVLLIGSAGSGKTSISLKAKQRYSYDIISGDTTLVKPNQGKLSVIAGTQVLTIRERDHDKWPELQHELQKIRNRYILRLADAPPNDCHIKAIAMVQLNDGHNLCEQLSPESALHTTYPFFMDYERFDVLLDNGNDLINGNIPYTLKKNLLKEFKPAIINTRAYTLSGSMEYVLEKIQEILD